jgi:hypothetical protein
MFSPSDMVGWVRIASRNNALGVTKPRARRNRGNIAAGPGGVGLTLSQSGLVTNIAAVGGGARERDASASIMIAPAITPPASSTPALDHFLPRPFAVTLITRCLGSPEWMVIVSENGPTSVGAASTVTLWVLSRAKANGPAPTVTLRGAATAPSSTSP